MGKKYQYTVDNCGLSDEQRQFYEDNGYIVIKKLIPDENLDKCYQRFLKVCDGDAENVSDILRITELKKCPGLKDEYTINKIQGFMYDPILFDNYINHEKIIKVVASIIGPNITAFNSMIVNKPPNAPYKYSRHALHQDQYYFPLGPTNRIVGSWTAMEEATDENGCLFVIPGTHKGDLLPHPKGISMQAYFSVEGFDDVPRVNLHMKKGDTVFFNPLLIHGSGPNYSNGFRKAISAHYADTNCYFYDFKGTISESMEAGIILFLESKGQIFRNLAHYVKSRARLITGDPGNFQKLPSQL